LAELEELRVQPQDILAEQSVLGAIFLDEGKLVFVREYIEAEDFFKHAHKLIFKAMIALSDRNEAIDATTMRNYLVTMVIWKILVAWLIWRKSSVLYRQQPMRNSMPRLLRRNRIFVS